MKKSFKTALCTILGICLITAMLTGCAQSGNERALNPNGVNNGLNNGAQNQSLNRSNLVGGRYGYNGYTGYGTNGYGTNGRNMTGYGGYTGYDPSNYLSYNGINTIDYNNRFNRMGNYGTGMGNNGTVTGNNVGTTVTGYDRNRASMIERQLNKVNGVNNCSVMVSGDTALVALKKSGTNTANISRLRTTIERKVKQIDSSIKNVSVTDSPDILTRMGRLGTGTTGNFTGNTNNFSQEFRNMINSINTAGR